MIQMKRIVLRWALALAATGMLAGPALAAEGLGAEVPGALALQPVQAAAVDEQVAVLVAELPAQPALAEVPTQAAAGTLPAELPELPAVLALTPPEPFSAADMQALFVPGHEPLRVAVLSPQEMEETKGAVAPLVAIGIMHAGRFIATRHVSQSLATRMVQGGSRQVVATPGALRGVMATTAQQAAQIAGRGSIREFHSGSGARFTHFHPASRNGAHVWFGARR